MGLLSLISNPGDIALSRNPVIFQIRALDDAGDPYIIRGPMSEARATTYFYFNVGDTVNVAWTEPDGTTQTVTFTAAASPSTENQIYSGNPAGTHAATWALNAARIQAHSQVAPFLRIYSSDNGAGISIFAEVLEFSDDWGVELGGTITAGTVNFIDTATSSSNLPNNFKVLLDVHFEDSYQDGDFSSIATLQAIPDTAGYVTFNLQEVIDKAAAYSLADPPIPQFGTNEITKADVLRRFYVRYREDYDNIVSPAWTYDDLRLILCGGIAQNIFADYDFFTSFNADNAFLTWYPDGKNVSTDQPEYLPWINFTGADVQISAELRRTTATGTLSTLYRYTFNGLTLAPYEVALIPVGYTEINVASTDVKKYTVRVIDDSSDWEGGSPTYLSQSRSYYVDYSYYQDPRYLMYLNSFCCPLTLRCTGEIAKSIEIQRTQSERILAPDYSSTTAEVFQHDDFFRNLFTYHTGYLSRAEVDALQEMLIYNRIYEVYEEGYIPLYLTSDKWDIYTTRQFLHSLVLETIPAMYRKNYSNTNIDLVAPEGWRLSDDSDFWRTAFGETWKIA